MLLPVVLMHVTTAATDNRSGILKNFAPTMKVQRILALLLLIAQGGITVTGSTVRVTGSGLGCDSWPHCHPGSFTPVPGAAPALHQAIEFGNRLLTFVLIGLVIALFVSVVAASRRKEIIVHTVIQGIGVIVQAVIGGITVWMDLTWWLVVLHFLPSMLLVWLAAILYMRVGEPDDGVQKRPFDKSLRGLTALSTLLLVAVLVTGTLVTSAGPHAGDEAIGPEHRLNVDIDWMAHVHAYTMYGYLALTILLVAALFLMQAPAKSKRFGVILLLFIVIQGAVGIMQYRMGVPRWTVPVHVGLCSFVVAFGSLLWSTGLVREGGSPFVTGSAEGDTKRTAIREEKTIKAS